MPHFGAALQLDEMLPDATLARALRGLPHLQVHSDMNLPHPPFQAIAAVWRTLKSPWIPARVLPESLLSDVVLLAQSILVHTQL